MFVLIYLVIYIILLGIEEVLGILSFVFSLALLLPHVSITARRLHDVGKSGWWQLIYLIPLIGLIVMIVFLVQKGDANDNEYGQSPYNGGTEETGTVSDDAMANTAEPALDSTRTKVNDQERT